MLAKFAMSLTYKQVFRRASEMYFLRWQSLAFLIPALSFMSYFRLMRHPIFGTNDDVGMAMMSAGVLLAHQPTSSLLFIHPLYGKLLQALYTFDGDIPWYGGLFIFILFLSLVILNFASFRLSKGNAVRVFLPLIFLINLFAAFPLLYHLQFTIVSGVSSLSGFVLLFSVYLKPPKHRIQLLAALSTALGMILLGSMIRADSFYMICLLVAPVGVLSFFNDEIFRPKIGSLKYKLRSIKSYFFRSVPYVLIILGIFSLSSFQSAYYSSPEWQDWFTINRSKAYIIDYELIAYNESTKPLFEEVGWSKVNFDMIRSWQYVDSSIFPVESFRKIASGAVDERKIDRPTILGRLDRHTSMVSNSARSVPFLSLGISFLALINVVTWPINLRQFGSLATLGSAFLIFFYLAVFLNRTQFRTDVLIFSGTLWLLFLLLFYNENSGKIRSVFSRVSAKKVIAFAWSFAFLLIVLWSKYYAIPISERVSSFVTSSNEFQENVIGAWNENLPPDSVIYNIGAAFPYEYYLPLQSFKDLRSEKLSGFVGSGTMNQSPVQIETLKVLGLDQNFQLSLLKKEHAYLFTQNSRMDQFWVEKTLRDFYREKYDLLVRFEAQPDLPRLHRILVVESRR